MYGLPLIVSPMSTQGVPHSSCAYDENAIFANVIRDKLRTCYYIDASPRCPFLVLAAGSGCRLSDDLVVHSCICALPRVVGARLPSAWRTSTVGGASCPWHCTCSLHVPMIRASTRPLAYFQPPTTLISGRATPPKSVPFWVTVGSRFAGSCFPGLWLFVFS